jgi:type IV pilus assembly protein PilA
MSKTHRFDGQRGFSLIELMLVVGIIGAIAAIAIPNFITYQARSRRSEAFTNLAAMANAQKAFQAERNYFHDSVLASGIMSDVPDVGNYGGAHGTRKMPWDADAKAAFGELGWSPEGQVFYSYAAFTSASAGGCAACPLCFTGAAYGNVDGSAGGPQLILYVHPDVVGGSTVACNDGIYGLPPVVDSSGNPIYDAVAARSNSDY